MIRCLAAATVVALIFLGPQTASAQAITPPSVTQTHTDVNVTVQAPPPDPAVIADSSMQSFQAIIVQLIAPTFIKWTRDVLAVSDVVTQTPPDMTYGNGAIRSKAEFLRNIAMAFLGLAVFVLGINITLRQEYAWGRIIMAVCFAATSLYWWQAGIDILNATNRAIAAPSVQDIIGPHLTLPSITANPIEAFGPALLVIVYCIVGLMLILAAWMRIALIDVLIVIGPLALMTMATMESSRFSTAYITTSVGTLFSQVMIVICLSVSPALAAAGSGLASTLIALCILWLAKSAPSLVTGAVRSGGSSAGRIGLIMVLRRALLRF